MVIVFGVHLMISYFFLQPNYTYIGEHCNLWRNFDDIDDSWDSVLSIIDYYGDNQDDLIPFAGPGHWNDPDMVFYFNITLFGQSLIYELKITAYYWKFRPQL